MKRLLPARAVRSEAEIGALGPSEQTVILHDGTKVTIAPGKSKRFIIRGTKFHLLDCACDACEQARQP